MSAWTGKLGALRHRDFRCFQAARFLVTLALNVQSVAVGWRVYEQTRDPLHLGWVGLAQFVPLVLLAPITGHVADRHDRRRVVSACGATFTLALAGLAWLERAHPDKLGPLYAMLVVLGAGRAFYGPAAAALLPQLVPAGDLPSAVGWSSTLWQVATVAGPALGGLTYSWLGASSTFTAASLVALIGVALLALLRHRDARTTPPRELGLAAGLRFVWRHPPLLGAISLDLFAVLLGGAVALLPALAQDVLHVGPAGLGMLRGAPAAGATLTAATLALRPLNRHAGATMLGAVALFGAATIVLGVSTSFWVSLVALSVLGAADMLSVFVRHTLVQLATPDAMRGRVSAVNQVFIGASNELGELESGVTAAWWGVAPAVIAGGAGTLVVVVVWTLLFPALRRIDRLGEVRPLPEA